DERHARGENINRRARQPLVGGGNDTAEIARPSTCQLHRVPHHDRIVFSTPTRLDWDGELRALIRWIHPEHEPRLIEREAMHDDRPCSHVRSYAPMNTRAFCYRRDMR